MKDVFGNVSKICYNTFNVPVRTIDVNGLVTEYEYNADGLVTAVTRKDGAETLASVTVAYDESAHPVSVRDQDGRITAFDRDAFGRVLKETFADGSEVAYTYDAFGRRTGVLDENGHKIAFDWNRFGLSSRTTAENQLTDYVRDDDGLVTEILSKQDGRTDRSIKNEYDEYGRLVYVDYGKGETEKFAYDKWGRVASHSRGDLKTDYAYDHFGRLAKKDETSATSSPSSFTYTSYTYDNYGSRTSRITRNRKGEIVSKETRAYDRYGRLAETVAFGSSVKYAYDAKGHLTSQTINGELIKYVYTRRGQLAGKYLGGKLKPDAAVEYEYSPAGQITARTANGVRQTYEYDFKGQLLGVKEGEEYVERYAYDKAGNMVRKTVRGKTTAFTFDDANQLVSSTTDGVTTRYEYDAAGRLVREGDKTYTYGYLDKVMSVRFDRSSSTSQPLNSSTSQPFNSSTSQPLNSSTVYTYTYHPDGQLATANYGDSSEDFTWDGLALVKRGDEQFINEPHVGGGNPVVSSKGTSFFNDMLGTTVGAKSGKTYSSATLSAFGEDVTSANSSTSQPFNFSTYFTGKPEVAGLGHAFLMRNYRAGLGKWQTADPLGYPDGWNQLAYCNNGVTGNVDLWGCVLISAHIVTASVSEGGSVRPKIVIAANELDHTFSIDITISYAVADSITKSAAVSNGTIVTYMPHNGEINDSYMINPVYEPTLAHELGHAEYIAETYSNSLWVPLWSLEYDWEFFGYSVGMARGLAANICDTMYDDCVNEIANAANEPTISWFDDSLDWVRLPEPEVEGAISWKKNVLRIQE